MKNRIYVYIVDYIAIIIGVLTIISSFCCQMEKWMNILTPIAFGIGVIYFAYIFRRLLFIRPKFDWHLLHGNYILKVIVLGLLTPSIITFCIQHFAPLLTAKDLLGGSIKQSPSSLLWSVYYHFMHSGDPAMAKTGLSRWWIEAIAILSVFLMNGLLVSSIVGSVDLRKGKWLKGEVKYPGFLLFKSHYVIIGGNDMVAGIVSQIFEAESKSSLYKTIFLPYILIQTSRNVEEFRRELFSSLTQRQQRHIIIYYGNRNSQEDISALKCGRAKEVFILGEDTRTDDNESYHDTMNMVCLRLLSEEYKSTTSGWIIRIMNAFLKPLLKFVDEFNKEKKEKAAQKKVTAEEKKTDNQAATKNTIKKQKEDLCKRINTLCKQTKKAYKPLKLKCRVMFEYQATFNIMQVTDIDGDFIEFLPFNYYEMWAQKVLVCRELYKNADCKYLPLEGFNGIKSNEEKFVHLVVVGMSRMGVAMAIEAAHLAHYPNFDTKKKRTRITFIDSNMEQEKHFFMGRFKEMFAVAPYRDVPKGATNIYNNPRYCWFDPLTNVYSKSPYKGTYLGENFIDVEWEFIHGSVENPDIQQYLEEASANNEAKLTIAICLSENSRAIAAATYLRDSVYKSKSTTQVLIYQRLNEELVKQINGNKRYCGKLKAFGMVEECYDLSLVTISEFIVTYVDDAYNKFKGWSSSKMDFCTRIREYICCRYKVSKFQLKKSTIVAPANSSKKKAEGKTHAAKMWSTQYNVYTMWTKFRCFDIDPMCSTSEIKHKKQMYASFSDEIMIALGKMEHNRWIIEQLLLRYRPLTKDEQNKYHRITDYSSDEDQKEFDTLADIDKKAYAHICLCSNNKLREINCRMPELDKALIKVLPQAYKDYLVTTEGKENKKGKQ